MPPEPSRAEARRTAAPASACRARLRRVRRRDGRRGVRLGAALRLVLPHHRLRRHAADRALGAQRNRSSARSSSASTPMSRRGWPGSFAPAKREVEIKVGETMLVHYIAREHRRTGRARAPRPTMSRRGRGRRLFQQARVLLLHRAARSRRRAARDAGRFLRRPGDRQGPDSHGIHEITLSYTFFPAERAAGAGGGARRPGNSCAEARACRAIAEAMSE